MKIISATSLENKKLKLSFEDGCVGIVNLHDYFNLIGVLEILNDENVFKQVKIKNNCLHWSDDCISPLKLFMPSSQIKKFTMMAKLFLILNLKKKLGIKRIIYKENCRKIKRIYYHILSAAIIGEYSLHIHFSDDVSKKVDFKPFLRKSTNPEIRKYLNPFEFL